jgi:hypothetical protein
MPRVTARFVAPALLSYGVYRSDSCEIGPPFDALVDTFDKRAALSAVLQWSRRQRGLCAWRHWNGFALQAALIL